MNQEWLVQNKLTFRSLFEVEFLLQIRGLSKTKGRLKMMCRDSKEPKVQKNARLSRHQKIAMHFKTGA